MGEKTPKYMYSRQLFELYIELSLRKLKETSPETSLCLVIDQKLVFDFIGELSHFSARTSEGKMAKERGGAHKDEYEDEE